MVISGYAAQRKKDVQWDSNAYAARLEREAADKAELKQGKQAGFGSLEAFRAYKGDLARRHAQAQDLIRARQESELQATSDVRYGDQMQAMQRTSSAPAQTQPAAPQTMTREQAVAKMQSDFRNDVSAMGALSNKYGVAPVATAPASKTPPPPAPAAQKPLDPNRPVASRLDNAGNLVYMRQGGDGVFQQNRPGETMNPDYDMEFRSFNRNAEDPRTASMTLQRADPVQASQIDFAKINDARVAQVNPDASKYNEQLAAMRTSVDSQTRRGKKGNGEVKTVAQALEETRQAGEDRRNDANIAARKYEVDKTVEQTVLNREQETKLRTDATRIGAMVTMRGQDKAKEIATMESEERKGISAEAYKLNKEKLANDFKVAKAGVMAGLANGRVDALSNYFAQQIQAGIGAGQIMSSLMSATVGDQNMKAAFAAYTKATGQSMFQAVFNSVTEMQRRSTGAPTGRVDKDGKPLGRPEDAILEAGAASEAEIAAMLDS